MIHDDLSLENSDVHLFFIWDFPDFPRCSSPWPVLESGEIRRMDPPKSGSHRWDPLRNLSMTWGIRMAHISYGKSPCYQWVNSL